ncbi:MAG: flavin reductase family protein [Clostridiales bacterium]|nr:flavin reductase family protein [Clostridiales bacterium]
MKQSINKGFITPQPVFIIATYDENGEADAMNAAWAGQIGGNQLSISLSPHKTTDNLRAIGEFTVSFATAEHMAACDYVGIVSKNKVPDKLEKCGFTVTKSDKINAPVIDQLPVAVECKVIELQEEFNETRVVAEIVGMKADEKVLTDGKVDLSKVHPIMFDSSLLCYREIGDKLGGAWDAGKKFM